MKGIAICYIDKDGQEQSIRLTNKEALEYDKHSIHEAAEAYCEAQGYTYIASGSCTMDRVTPTPQKTLAVPAPHKTHKRFLLVFEDGFLWKEIDSTDYASEAKRLAAYYREQGQYGPIVILCSASDQKLLNA